VAKTLLEIEARIQILEDTRQREAEKANAAMLPLQMQIGQITQRATESLARIDGQLIVLKEQVDELKPAPQPVATDQPAIPGAVETP
jgi:hypothetical protein